MAEQHLDWSAFQRLDNAAVVDFLTSTASALCEAGAFSAKETDNLRLVLSGIHAAADSREKSLLLELDAQHAEFLDVLEARFGTVGVCLNLMRHTLRPSLAETQRILAELGQGLVKKAELLFNRPFYIYRGGRCQRQTLFSTVIVDFSETLAAACGELQTALGALSLMNPNDMAASGRADEEVDLAIARALGFTGLITHSLPMHTEAEIKRRVSQALAQVAEAAVEISEQLAANTQAETAHDVVAAAEWLASEAQRLALLEFPRAESLLAWEVRRRNLTACVHGLNEALRQLALASLGSLGREAPTAATRLPESARRRLAYDLMVAGAAPAKAREAAAALLTYLETNRLTPREVLPAELARIHPSLMPRSLETLAALAGDTSTMSLAASEKQATMTRARRLAEAFRPLAAPATLLLACALVGSFASGCGLKTAPKSDIDELRPEIPYHYEAPPQVAAPPPKSAVRPAGAPPESRTHQGIQGDEPLTAPAAGVAK